MYLRQRKSPRLQRWDYHSPTAYFITICTKDRQHYFGEVGQGKMQLSPAGIVADILWHEIRHHAKDIELGEFVVMPNHVHGILILKGDASASGQRENEASIDQASSSAKSPGQARFRNQGKNSVSSIIGAYKSAVSRHCHRLGLAFAWHGRFYDHIIRNEAAFRNIAAYIRNNPRNWKADKFSL